TAHGTERMAVETMKLGAFDYVPKPFDVDELRLAVRNAVEFARLQEENERLRTGITGSGPFGEMIGDSPAMKRVYSLIEKVAETGANVLIAGESGTGKELVAREIHRRSHRSGPFVAVNCAALPQDLVESELFGHEKGAFTGAAARRAGKFEVADKGTLFLDEIGDMAPVTQAKLLRVLEDRQFQRLGGNETLTTDVRIISATNRNLEEMESPEVRFRQDLYYRLSVVTVTLPSLWDRKEDIPALVRAFASRYGTAYKGGPLAVSEAVYKLLVEKEWPGNVRQLRNTIERAVVMCSSNEITLDVINEESSDKSQADQEQSPQKMVDVEAALTLKDAKHEFERRYIEKCLEEASGNITKAAAQLGMHRQSLQHKLKDLGLIKKFVLID
ncbi:MAG: sigma-54-dependent transcriptional regulator, partial [Blastocatellia bacterium]